MMRESILPALDQRTATILPISATALETGADLEEMFPYGTAFHDSFEWMWLLSNSSHIKINQSVYRMSSGDFCLIPPGVSHAEMYSPATPEHQSLWFSHNPSTSRIVASYFDYDSFGHGRITEWCTAEVPGLFRTLLVGLQNEMTGEQPHALEICRSLVMTLAYMSIRALETASRLEPGCPTTGYLSLQVLQYLRRHYAESISVEDVAQAVHLSRSYLATAFKKETGKTIGQTLTEIRLEHARLLLMEERLPIRDVAKAVGFRSPEHFCRVFKSHEKIAPGAYRK